MVLNLDEIKEILPHRYPFLFVDRVDELEMGKRAVGSKNMTADTPVMPHVLIIEALAQLAGCAIPGDSKESKKIAFFAGISGARFLKQVQPGNTLTLEIEILSLRRNICKAKGVAKVGKDIVCIAEEMIFALGK